MATVALKKLYSERTNWLLLLVAFCVALVGLLLMSVAGRSDFEPFWKQHVDLQRLVKDIGSLLFVSVAVTFLWELVGKRAFRDELLATVKAAQQIKGSGIVEYWHESSFHDNSWKELFQNAKKVDVVFHYGSTWRSVHHNDLRSLAAKSGAKLRVVLPDYEDGVLLEEMARRFNCSKESVRTKVIEAEKFFVDLRSEFEGNGAEVEVWLSKYPFAYSYYRFDHKAIVSLYRNVPQKSAPPTFVVEEGGDLFSYALSEVERLTNGSNNFSRCVTKSNANTRN